MNQSINSKTQSTVFVSDSTGQANHCREKGSQGDMHRPVPSTGPDPRFTSSATHLLSRRPRASLTCIGRLFAMVKLGMGGRALYVLVRAVSVRPNMEPEVKEETAEKGT